MRIDLETHALVAELSKSSGASHMQTVRDAVQALRRERFARRVVAEMAALRSDDEAWQDYLREADSTVVSDGIGR